MRQIQHGDVLLRQVRAVPEGAMKQARKGESIVVMAGETTGHAHVITNRAATVWMHKGQMYIELPETAVISHDEHRALPIPPGIYEVGQVKEYDYFAEMERKVLD